MQFEGTDSIAALCAIQSVVLLIFFLVQHDDLTVCDKHWTAVLVIVFTWIPFSPWCRSSGNNQLSQMIRNQIRLIAE